MPVTGCYHCGAYVQNPTWYWWPPTAESFFVCDVCMLVLRLRYMNFDTYTGGFTALIQAACGVLNQELQQEVQRLRRLERQRMKWMRLRRRQRMKRIRIAIERNNNNNNNSEGVSLLGFFTGIILAYVPDLHGNEHVLAYNALHPGGLILKCFGLCSGFIRKFYSENVDVSCRLQGRRVAKANHLRSARYTFEEYDQLELLS